MLNTVPIKALTVIKSLKHHLKWLVAIKTVQRQNKRHQCKSTSKYYLYKQNNPVQDDKRSSALQQDRDHPVKIYFAY